MVVVDPKGDLVSDILMRLPEELGEKVVLFDGDSRGRPPILNPLEGNDKARSVSTGSSGGIQRRNIIRAGSA